MKDLLVIPEEYRCSPFDISPSSDLFWADIRNVEHVKEGIAEVEAGKTKRYTLNELKEKLGL